MSNLSLDVVWKRIKENADVIIKSKKKHTFTDCYGYPYNIQVLLNIHFYVCVFISRYDVRDNWNIYITFNFYFLVSFYKNITTFYIVAAAGNWWNSQSVKTQTRPFAYWKGAGRGHYDSDVVIGHKLLCVPCLYCRI